MGETETRGEATRGEATLGEAMRGEVRRGEVMPPPPKPFPSAAPRRVRSSAWRCSALPGGKGEGIVNGRVLSFRGKNQCILLKFPIVKDALLYIYTPAEDDLDEVLNGLRYLSSSAPRSSASIISLCLKASGESW